MNDFLQTGICSRLIEQLSAAGITEPTPVQKTVIPMILQKKNVMFQSETGTGKTFAYLLPLIQMLEEDKEHEKTTGLLIVSPTQELASQIKIQAQLLTDLKTVLCIGGSSIARQVEQLKSGCRIAAGGAERLLELIHLKKLKVSGIKAVVLDEADRLLSKELRDGTTALLERLPKSVQIIANSATVSEFTRKTLESVRTPGNSDSPPVEFVSLPKEDILRERIEHWAIFAKKRDKVDMLRRLINAVEFEKMIVFSAKGNQVDVIASKLRAKKIECESLSRNTDKKLRHGILEHFRSGKTKILITTDLTSRGLDVQGISHVIQLDLPQTDDFFIHRAGRTGRAGKTGINCVIGDEFEMQKYALLEKKLGIKVYPKELYGGKLVKPEAEQQV